MQPSLSVQNVLKEATRHARTAISAGWGWALVFALCGGLYRAIVVSGVGGGWMAAAALLAVFIAGVKYSLTLFQAMLGRSTGSVLSLAHANAAAAAAQAFVALCLLFFVGLFGVMMLQLSGLIDLAASPEAEAVTAAQKQLYSTPYGAALMVVFGLAGLISAFIAIRLLLVGPATVTDGAARVFRTWTFTEGRAKTLGIAALVTHVLPMAAALLAINILQSALPATVWSAALTGVFGIIALIPFFLLGHGLSVSAFQRLSPQ